VVYTGDFLQLPPVAQHSPSFAFEADVWQESPPTTFELTTMFRQQDPAFVAMLANVRKGIADPAVWELLPPRINAPLDREAVALFARRVDVATFNADRLAQLPGGATRYTATSTGTESLVKNFKAKCNAPEHLDLKIGASVILVKNLATENGLVNGSQGVVTGLHSDQVSVDFGHITASLGPETWAVEDGARVLASYSQIPLMLGWGLTIHKSQGMSLDAVNIDLENCFEAGQGYVALSRARSLAGLSIVDRVVASALNPNRKAKKFYESLQTP
jgi:ATP-dependent DNA helicase PIF1